MRMVLHIGTHKTGTTTIQKFVDRHRKKLANRGFWYPNYRIILRPGQYAHQDLAHGFAGQSTKRIDYDLARKFIKKICAQGADYDTVFLSSEPFYRHTFPETKEGSPDYWKNRRAYVERVGDAFGGADVSIVAVVRRQDHFAQSLYNENLKVTRYARALEDFFEDKFPLFQYGEQFKIWADLFGAVNVMIFEDLVAAPRDLAKEFLQRVGCPVGKLEPIEARNASMSCELLEYKRHLNQTKLTRPQLAKLTKRLQDPDFMESARLTRSKQTWASPETFSKFLTRFSEENEWVKNNCTELERATLFPEGPGPHGEVFKGLSEVDSRNITAALLDERL